MYMRSILKHGVYIMCWAVFKSVPCTVESTCVPAQQDCVTLELSHLPGYPQRNTDVRVISSILWSQVCGPRNYLYLVQNLQFSLYILGGQSLLRCKFSIIKQLYFHLDCSHSLPKCLKFQVQWSEEQKVFFFIFCQFSFILLLYETSLWKKFKQAYLI